MDELRGRAVAVLTSAAVVAGFVSALVDEPPAWMVVMLGAALSVAALSAVAVLWPASGWKFTFSPERIEKAAHDAVAAGEPVYDQWAVGWLAEDHKNNDRLLRRTVRWLRAEVVAVAVLVAIFVVAVPMA